MLLLEGWPFLSMCNNHKVIQHKLAEKEQKVKSRWILKKKNNT